MKKYVIIPTNITKFDSETIRIGPFHKSCTNFEIFSDLLDAFLKANVIVSYEMIWDFIKNNPETIEKMKKQPVFLKVIRNINEQSFLTDLL